MSQNTDLLNYYIKYSLDQVEGWLHPDAISIISHIDRAQKEFNIQGHICEIGVHHGLLFILLYLLARQKENALAVDIFDQQYLNIDQSGEGNLEIFIKNLEKFAKNKQKLKIIASDSTKISSDDIKTTVGGEVRLFSVDGGHTTEITKNDLKIASQSICEGGVIILDDCFNGLFPGVFEGTNEFFRCDNERGIVPFAIATGNANKVFLTSSSYAEKYIQYLLECNLANVFYSRQPELFGHRVISLQFSPPNLKSLVWKKIKNKFLGKQIKIIY